MDEFPTFLIHLTGQMCGFSRDQAKLMDEFPPLGGETKGKKKSAVGKKK